MLRAKRPLKWLLFLGSFIAFAYFNQGGGWNQNGRFAMVRALVEQGTFSIDNYLIYIRAESDPGNRLKRIPTRNGEYETDGEKNILLWASKTRHLMPVSGVLEGAVAAIDPGLGAIDIQDHYKTAVRILVSKQTQIQSAYVDHLSLEKVGVGQTVNVLCALTASGDVAAKTITVVNTDDDQRRAYRELGSVAATGDLAFYRGHFYPNKAPGTSLLAVPGYWIVFHFEKSLGLDPDNWWTLTLNAWLTSVLSVGILSALGVVVFYKLAFAFSGGRAQLSFLATCAFAFGTMFFPNATLLFEHNIIGVALLGSFYLLYRAKVTAVAERAGAQKSVSIYCFLGGLFAGVAAITNYIAVGAVLFLAAYGLYWIKRRTFFPWYALGLLGPFLLICAYNAVCFGIPFTTNYQYQNPDFIDQGQSFLSVFTSPHLDVLLIILFSPYRGLFFTAPVLLITITALGSWVRGNRLRAESLLITGIFTFFLLVNISFNGWDGGDVAVARYLGPAIPILSLGLVHGFGRFFKITWALAAVSVAFMTLITVVDPLPPTGTGTAVVLDKPQWQYNPVFDYELPVFLTGQPLPLLRQQELQVLRCYDRHLSDQGSTKDARRTELQRVRNSIDEKIAAGQPAPLLITRSDDGQYLIGDSDLSVPVGPVSVHTYSYSGGSASGNLGGVGWTQARRNSFNVGEFLFPESRWSLLPLLMVEIFLGYIALASARQLDQTKSKSDRG
jgi:hypothetical protein